MLLRSKILLVYLSLFILLVVFLVMRNFSFQKDYFLTKSNFKKVLFGLWLEVPAGLLVLDYPSGVFELPLLEGFVPYLDSSIWVIGGPDIFLSIILKVYIMVSPFLILISEWFNWYIWGWPVYADKLRKYLVRIIDIFLDYFLPVSEDGYERIYDRATINLTELVRMHLQELLKVVLDTFVPSMGGGENEAIQFIKSFLTQIVYPLVEFLINVLEDIYYYPYYTLLVHLCISIIPTSLEGQKLFVVLFISISALILIYCNFRENFASSRRANMHIKLRKEMEQAEFERVKAEFVRIQKYYSDKRLEEQLCRMLGEDYLKEFQTRQRLIFRRGHEPYHMDQGYITFQGSSSDSIRASRHLRAVRKMNIKIFQLTGKF